jgi:DNA-binding transcriptional LysR family regulator
MSDIDQIRLRRLDLTVLLVFLGLMRRRKATEVGRELGLTQSAVSHALRRLREIFGDELFLRRPHGLEPTAVAIAAEAPIQAAVDQLRAALAAPGGFEPANAEGLVRIAAYDAELATLLPPLLCRLGHEAPGLTVAARALGRREALDALVAGEIDVALGFFWNLDDAFVAVPLLEEEYRVVGGAATRKHGPLTLERYLALPHILVSPGGDLRGIVDTLLERDGRSRRVVAAVPLFFPALAAVRGSRAVATIPRRIAEAYAPAFDLWVADPPLAIRRFTVAAVRHRRNLASPLQLWLNDILGEIVSAPEAGAADTGRGREARAPTARRRPA